jgi:ABC-type spermidine/putrescine transport system permease subunit I
MKNYHCLTFDSSRNDLISVLYYEMGDFNLSNLWGGKQNISISNGIQFFIDNKGNFPDLMGNPISWLICSDK